jgi:2-hydroxychromene-2-carboxylate isomerase
MPESISFYFDFSSPYGYLAAQKIDGIAARHGREVAWRPMLLGAVFKQTGVQPIVDIPMKGDYSRHDLARGARRIGVPFVWPETFPIFSVPASRAVYWLDAEDPVAARGLSKALFAAAFGKGLDISTPESVAKIAGGQGHDPQSVLDALQAQEVKDRLRGEVEGAIEKGVFGSPFFFVDGEPFWGFDRLPDVEHWLESGGW